MIWVSSSWVREPLLLIKFQKEDIYMGNQSKATISLIESDELLNAVESAVGEL